METNSGTNSGNRGKRITNTNRNKTNYARMLANFRTNRLKKTVWVNMIASKVGKRKTQEASVTSDRKFFTTWTYWES